MAHLMVGVGYGCVGVPNMVWGSAYGSVARPYPGFAQVKQVCSVGVSTQSVGTMRHNVASVNFLLAQSNGTTGC